MELTALEGGTRIRADFGYTGMAPGHEWFYATFVDRVEAGQLSEVPEPWPLAVPDGTGFFEITSDAGFRELTVRIEIYVEGNLLAAAEIFVP